MYTETQFYFYTPASIFARLHVPRKGAGSRKAQGNRRIAMSRGRKSGNEAGGEGKGRVRERGRDLNESEGNDEHTVGTLQRTIEMVVYER